MQTLQVRPQTFRPEGFSTIMQVKPCVSTFTCHADIAISKTAQNSLGLSAHTLAAHPHRCHFHDYQPNVRAPSLIDHTKNIEKPIPNVVTASSVAIFSPFRFLQDHKRVQGHKAVLPGSFQAQTVSTRPGLHTALSMHMQRCEKNEATLGYKNAKKASSASCCALRDAHCGKLSKQEASRSSCIQCHLCHKRCQSTPPHRATLTTCSMLERHGSDFALAG